MPSATIDRLIINSPYEEPAQHWRYERETRTFDLVDRRRPAGYVVASGDGVRLLSRIPEIFEYFDGASNER